MTDDAALERLRDIQHADQWRTATGRTLDKFLNYAVVRMALQGEEDPTMRAMFIARDLVAAMDPDVVESPLGPKHYAYLLGEAMYRLLEKDGRL
jgi:hypothetical protein